MSDGSSTRVGGLSVEKQALLVLQRKKKLAAEAAAARTAAGIPRRGSQDPAPLSLAQQRLWLLDRLEPGTTAYNIPFQARLRGPLDRTALAGAVEAIVRRHEALRTTFAEREGEAVQRVSPPAAASLSLLDLAGLPAALRPAAESALVAAHLRPFDLERGPLFRAALVRLGDDEHLLLLDLHHIVADGWSLGVFFRELEAAYGALLAGGAPALPELPIQYADFALWQRHRLQGAALEGQIAYWRERLRGAPSLLELPLDRARPAEQSHRGTSLRTTLPASLVARVRELSLRAGASPFMTLLAAFQLLLSRLSGQDDVVVGSPSAGRNRREIEGMIGLFLNTLVLRTDLSGDPTFLALLDRVKEEGVLGAYQYQEVPFERLLEELQPERQLSYTPLFQVLFNYISLSNLELKLQGLAVERYEPDQADAKFDFTLYVQELPDALHCDLVYCTDLFEPERMHELLRQLEQLLAAAVAHPELPVGALSLVTAGAQGSVHRLPDPLRPLSTAWYGAVHQALSRGAGAHPERIAVEDASGTVWTYAGLEERANRLAHLLLAAGVKPGDAVAVWAHRGAPLVQALLGTLKAGCAILILDPAYPAPRLLDYLRIGRPTAWIAVPGAPEPPPEVAEIAGLCRRRLELTEAALAGFPDTDPGIAVGPDDAACITFTSGSTGLPKGVVGRHGPLTHYYPWMGGRFGFGPGDRFGMLSALSHDPLQRDVFTPIWFGAALAIPDSSRIGAAGYLAGWLRREEVTALCLTPAMMELVLDSASSGPERIGELPALRQAFVVGDLLKKIHVEHLQRLAPQVSCVNLYGSTETQRSVSYFPVPRGPELARLGKEVLPLGTGMEGCQLLVLNRAGRLAGVGEAGEIHTRSRHLARGYLGDDALTAERFFANPLAATPAPGDRVYRTGDIGRYLPDGGVEILGRADSQVKLRGFRIELGEIESALARQPGVAAAVALVREDQPGDRRLVAYVVGAGPAPSELRRALQRELPEPMVPSAFVFLDALPLTVHGKVDRKALPVPEVPQRRELTLPRTPFEEEIAHIWCEVLGVPQVGVDDSFWELGGHSLLATRVFARLNASFGVDLPFQTLFREPTLQGFSLAVAEAVIAGEMEEVLEAADGLS